MRFLAPSLLLAFLVFPAWNSKRPLKRQRAERARETPAKGRGQQGSPCADLGLAALSFERERPDGSKSPTGATSTTAASGSPRLAADGGGPPALHLVPPVSPAAGTPPAAAFPAGGTTYTDDLVRTAFQQLRERTDPRGHGLLATLEDMLLTERASARLVAAKLDALGGDAA